MNRILAFALCLLPVVCSAQFPPPIVRNYWTTSSIPTDAGSLTNAASARTLTTAQGLTNGIIPPARYVGNGTSSVKLAPSGDASKTGDVAIGNGANASGPGSTAVGAGTDAEGGHSAAFGFNALAQWSNSVAIGSFAQASGTNQIEIGDVNSETHVAGNFAVDGILHGNGGGLTNLVSSGGGTGISTNGGSGHNNNFTNIFMQGLTNNGAVMFKDKVNPGTLGIFVTNGSDQLYFTYPTGDIAGITAIFTGSGANLTTLNANSLASGTVPDVRLGIGSEVAGPFVTTNAGNASISHNAGGLTNSIASQFASINNWTKAVATAANFNLNLPVTNYQAQIVGQGFTVNALTGFITNTSAGDYAVSWSWSGSANPAGESTVSLFTNSVSTTRTSAGFINAGRGMAATWFITLPANCGSSIVPLTGGGVNCTNYEFAIRRLQ